MKCDVIPQPPLRCILCVSKFVYALQLTCGWNSFQVVSMNEVLNAFSWRITGAPLESQGVSIGGAKKLPKDVENWHPRTPHESKFTPYCSRPLLLLVYLGFSSSYILFQGTRVHILIFGYPFVVCIRKHVSLRQTYFLVRNGIFIPIKYLTYLSQFMGLKGVWDLQAFEHNTFDFEISWKHIFGE